MEDERDVSKINKPHENLESHEGTVQKSGCQEETENADVIHANIETKFEGNPVKNADISAETKSGGSESSVPIVTVFQKRIVDSLSLVEYMSTEERDTAITALKDIVDSSRLWKHEPGTPAPPASQLATPRGRGRPRGTKKNKTPPASCVKVEKKSNPAETRSKPESSQSRAADNLQEGIRRSSRALKPTYKVKNISPKQSIKNQTPTKIQSKIKSEGEDCAVETENKYKPESVAEDNILDDVADEVSEEDKPESPMTSQIEQDQTEVKVEDPAQVKHTDKVADEKVVPAKQCYKMDKDVKRFLQKMGQLKSKKKTLMSEVKIRQPAYKLQPQNVKKVEAGGGDTVGQMDIGQLVCKSVADSTERAEEQDLDTCAEEKPKEIVELNEKNRVCMRGFWLIRQDHGTGWRCETCGKVFLYRASGICHLRTHSKDRPFGCPQCLKRFSFKPNRQRHMAKAHNIKSIICRVCNASFGKKQDLIRHSMETHGMTSAQVKNYCAICDKTFNQRSSYKSHVRCKHTNEHTVYICQFCPKRFSFQSNLIRHVKIHTGDRPHKCSYCDAAFIERKSLTLHQMKSHDTPEVRAMLDVTQKYNCRICNKEFMNKGNLQVHQRVHTKEKPFSCSLCPKSFSIRSNLKRHEATHRGERPYPCPDCLKRFTEKRSMENHRRLHTGEKPYECEICSKRFSQRGTLNAHRPVHSKERNFKCQYCAASFLRSSHLSTHIWKHAKGGRLPCPHCDEWFTDRKDLIEHELTHSSDSQTCAFCQEQFPSSKELSRHLCTNMGVKLYQCMICGETFGCNRAASAHLSEKHPQEYKYNHTHEDGKEMITYVEPIHMLGVPEGGDKGNEYTTHIIVTNPGGEATETPLHQEHSVVTTESQLAAEGMVSLAGTASRIILGSETEASNSHQIISQETYEQLLSQAQRVGVEEVVSVGGEGVEGGSGADIAGVGQAETVFTVQYQNGEVYAIPKQQQQIEYKQ